MNRALKRLGVVLALSSSVAVAQEKWRVHEWGTFTSLQNENGEAIGGINTDDEPVPRFVHQLSDFLLLRPTEIPVFFFQGAPACHPDVTMRLETPVIYFHPPGSQKTIAGANVRVKFRGGWLTEFFPDAAPDAPGLQDGRFQFGPLHSSTESKLEWNHLNIGGDWPLTNTAEHVWTSPRAVKAALVQTPRGEAEKFLFYRGVAHLNAPLKISRADGSKTLTLRSQWEVPAGRPATIRSLWLVDIRPNRTLAFRALPAVTLDGDSNKILAQTSASFEAGQFRMENLTKLKSSLQNVLVSEGLYPDEALALLNTWELSYFKSAGLRVFFIVPREWTDFYLPLEVSMPAEVNRVMVGRIELVTPEERGSLQAIAQLPAAKIKHDAGTLRTNLNQTLMTPGRDYIRQWEQLVNGKRLATATAVPASYQTYLDLGRFRNALILDEAQRRPTEGLTNFITIYDLNAYKPLYK